MFDSVTHRSNILRGTSILNEYFKCSPQLLSHARPCPLAEQFQTHLVLERKAVTLPSRTLTNWRFFHLRHEGSRTILPLSSQLHILTGSRNSGRTLASSFNTSNTLRSRLTASPPTHYATPSTFETRNLQSIGCLKESNESFYKYVILLLHWQKIGTAAVCRTPSLEMKTEVKIFKIKTEVKWDHFHAYNTLLIHYSFSI